MKKCRQYAAFIGFSPFFVVQLRLWICLRSKLSKQIVHNHLPGKAKRVYPRNSTNWISSAVHTLKKKGKCWTPNILQSHWQAGLQCLSISQLDIIYDLFGIRKSFAQRLEQETDALSLWRIISNVSQTVERIVTTRTKTHSQISTSSFAWRLLRHFSGTSSSVLASITVRTFTVTSASNWKESEVCWQL